MIEYQTKWFGGRDEMLDWIGARIEEGGSWRFEVVPDGASVPSGYFVKAEPVVEEWVLYKVSTGGDYTAVCIPDNNTYVVDNWDDVPVVPEGVWGCFQVAPAAEEIYRKMNGGVTK